MHPFYFQKAHIVFRSRGLLAALLTATLTAVDFATKALQNPKLQKRRCSFETTFGRSVCLRGLRSRLS